MAYSKLMEDRRDELRRESMLLTPGERLLRSLELSELCHELRIAGKEALKTAQEDCEK